LRNDSIGDELRRVSTPEIRRLAKQRNIDISRARDRRTMIRAIEAAASPWRSAPSSRQQAFERMQAEASVRLRALQWSREQGESGE
jgi:hypothetical protein